MITGEEALYTRLVTTSGTTGVWSIVSTSAPRVYAVKLPPDVNLPALTYQKISAIREYAFINDPGVVEARYQLTSWSTTYGGAKTLAKAVHNNLKDFVGVMGGTCGIQVDCTRYENETDIYSEDADVFGIAQDFLVNYHE